MVAERIYDLMYRYWAPWDKVGVRRDLVNLMDSGRIDPDRYPRTIDLGCGTGANVVHLASHGYDSWGVDFSEVALRKAAKRAAEAEVEPHLVLGNLTARSIPGVDGPFDLIVDFGTLDDLRGENRRAMTNTVNRLARSETLFLIYCFYGEKSDLPMISFKGTSKMSHISPGELKALFEDDWNIESFSSDEDWHIATFLMERR